VATRETTSFLMALREFAPKKKDRIIFVHSIKAIFAVGHRENNKLAATHRQHLLLPSTIMKS
jgi:hypothetical protein